MYVLGGSDLCGLIVNFQFFQVITCVSVHVFLFMGTLIGFLELHLYKKWVLYKFQAFSLS